MVEVVRSVPLPSLVPQLRMPDRVGWRRQVQRAPQPREPLPLPAPPLLVGRDVVFGMCRLDDKGRVSDLTVMAASGWSPGVRVGFAVSRGVVVVTAQEQGRQAICPRGCLRLPTTVRRAIGVYRSERVLLAALPERQRLIVHSSAKLDQLTAAVHTEALVGER
ncbi:hypothetical protein [Actinoplanes aureus]|uniref:Uncharacterized protein n=1 Tax=Actinoplanes aureus TaxID=2792083 RepID=A0A931G7N9_9ACTN|nr:hypothetical protein [Actinoplanes aureus]MBG0568454.1 hypothetical protein [Actinoplanes aureus]